ncbi:hypothetical protein BDP27DRAFT_1365803 [Rhodocollybia butyracea]|uniref:Uncharacterized protein n=1 Tax=Rhodocollybia butyracea TaxID=206335 RepID=A0A9P5U530_9AGAR|nr:hypothetical protein BDP27DRAFT_1365803 [Rhodocollybia butyracea]
MSADPSVELIKLIRIMGPAVLAKYRQTIYATELFELYPELCPLDTPLEWVSLDKVKPWLTFCPAHLPPPPTPVSFVKHETNEIVVSAVAGPSKKSTKRKACTTSKTAVIKILDLSNDEKPPLKSRCTTNNHRSKGKNSTEKGDVKVTRQVHVDHVEYHSSPLSTWPISGDKRIAHVIDMTGTPDDEWHLERGQPISMHSLVMKTDQDAWGNGTYGTKNPQCATSVALLDDAKCQVARLQCQGAYHCDHFDTSVLSPRFDIDDAPGKVLWDAERSQNSAEASSALAVVAAYYQDITSTVCDHTTSNERICGGAAVLRPLKEELFKHKGKYPKHILEKNKNAIPSKKCYHLIPPRNHRGTNLCLREDLKKDVSQLFSLR